MTVDLVGSPSSATPVGVVSERRILLLQADDRAGLVRLVHEALAAARQGLLAEGADARPHPDAAVRLAVDHGSAPELAAKLARVVKALDSGHPMALRLLRQQGVHLHQAVDRVGEPGGGWAGVPRVAFLFTGQGSQYPNMLRDLAAREPVVRATFEEADQVLARLVGVPLTSAIHTESDDPAVLEAMEAGLRRVEVVQPGVLACGVALCRLLARHGVVPDLVMGHSLGEYGALVAAGALTFPGALEAVAIRYMPASLRDAADPGAMAAVFGPLDQIRRTVEEHPGGGVVVANVNSGSQAVVGGVTVAVDDVVERFQQAGLRAFRIPVSHAFHTEVVTAISAPLMDLLRACRIGLPAIPTVTNLTGDFYPASATPDTVADVLGRHLASPVEFVKGLHTLYEAGARVFVEVGPKKALHGFVEDVLGDRPDVLSLFTNHPKLADHVAFNQALCGLRAVGVGGR
jgi:acyl transferase domain-containing protein